METKDQLVKIAVRKWRWIQALTIFSGVLFGIFGYFGKSPLSSLFAGIALGLALTHEFVIIKFPEMSADELRETLGRKR